MHTLQGSFPPAAGKIADGANLRLTSLPHRYRTTGSGKAADSEMWERMVGDGVTFHFEPVVIHRYWHWRPGFGG